MLISRDQEKLRNAIVYFSQNTARCGKMKLFKLLFLLDYVHYSEIGRSVTGLSYEAWDNGPYPKKLADEIDQICEGNPSSDLWDDLEFHWVPTDKRPMLQIKSDKPADISLFSRRELRILDALAKEYFQAGSEVMIDITHVPGGPWDIVYNERGEKNAEIPYDLSLPRDSALIREIAADREEFIRQFAK